MEELPNANKGAQTNELIVTLGETNELVYKRQKLQAFIDSDRFKELDNVEQYLLLHQYTVMGDYLSILRMRAEYAKAHHPELSRYF